MLIQRNIFPTDPNEKKKVEKVGGGACGVMVKAMDFGIEVCEFEIQSRYYVHFRTNSFGKSMNPLILPAMG